MLKLTSLALGLLTVIAIAPRSEAMSTTVTPLSIEQPAANLHSQVIFKVGQPGYSRRSEAQRRRERAAELRRRQSRGRNGKYDRNERNERNQNR
jgi:hypothetical protein